MDTGPRPSRKRETLGLEASCRLAVTAGSVPTPGWRTAATHPSKAPRGTANWPIRRTASDHSPLCKKAREHGPTLPCLQPPVRFPRDCELEARDSRPAEGRAPHEVTSRHHGYRNGQQRGPGRLSLGPMNREARPSCD